MPKTESTFKRSYTNYTNSKVGHIRYDSQKLSNLDDDISQSYLLDQNSTSISKNGTNKADENLNSIKIYKKPSQFYEEEMVMTTSYLNEDGLGFTLLFPSINNSPTTSLNIIESKRQINFSKLSNKISNKQVTGRNNNYGKSSRMYKCNRTHPNMHMETQFKMDYKYNVSPQFQQSLCDRIADARNDARFPNKTLNFNGNCCSGDADFECSDICYKPRYDIKTQKDTHRNNFGEIVHSSPNSDHFEINDHSIHESIERPRNYEYSQSPPSTYSHKYIERPQQAPNQALIGTHKYNEYTTIKPHKYKKPLNKFKYSRGNISNSFSHHTENSFYHQNKKHNHTFHQNQNASKNCTTMIGSDKTSLITSSDKMFHQKSSNYIDESIYEKSNPIEKSSMSIFKSSDTHRGYELLSEVPLASSRFQSDFFHEQHLIADNKFKNNYTHPQNLNYSYRQFNGLENTLHNFTPPESKQSFRNGPHNRRELGNSQYESSYSYNMNLQNKREPENLNSNALYNYNLRPKNLGESENNYYNAFLYSNFKLYNHKESGSNHSNLPYDCNTRLDNQGESKDSHSRVFYNYKTKLHGNGYPESAHSSTSSNFNLKQDNQKMKTQNTFKNPLDDFLNHSPVLPKSKKLRLNKYHEDLIEMNDGLKALHNSRIYPFENLKENLQDQKINIPSDSAKFFTNNNIFRRNKSTPTDLQNIDFFKNAKSIQNTKEHAADFPQNVRFKADKHIQSLEDGRYNLSNIQYAHHTNHQNVSMKNTPFKNITPQSNINVKNPYLTYDQKNISNHHICNDNSESIAIDSLRNHYLDSRNLGNRQSYNNNMDKNFCSTEKFSKDSCKRPNLNLPSKNYFYKHISVKPNVKSYDFNLQAIANNLIENVSHYHLISYIVSNIIKKFRLADHLLNRIRDFILRFLNIYHLPIKQTLLLAFFYFEKYTVYKKINGCLCHDFISSAKNIDQKIAMVNLFQSQIVKKRHLDKSLDTFSPFQNDIPSKHKKSYKFFDNPEAMENQKSCFRVDDNTKVLSTVDSGIYGKVNYCTDFDTRNVINQNLKNYQARHLESKPYHLNPTQELRSILAVNTRPYKNSDLHTRNNPFYAQKEVNSHPVYCAEYQKCGIPYQNQCLHLANQTENGMNIRNPEPISTPDIPLSQASYYNSSSPNYLWHNPILSQSTGKRHYLMQKIDALSYSYRGSPTSIEFFDVTGCNTKCIGYAFLIFVLLAGKFLEDEIFCLKDINDHSQTDIFGALELYILEFFDFNIDVTSEMFNSLLCKISLDFDRYGMPK